MLVWILFLSLSNLLFPICCSKLSKLKIPPDIKKYIDSILEEKIAKHETEVHELKHLIRNQNYEIKELRSEVEVLKRQFTPKSDILVHVYDQSFDDAGLEVPDVKGTTGQDKSRKERIIQQPASSSRVAFYASLSNSLSNLGENQDIVFDKVVTNVGNGYVANHGSFVAPVAGVYLFSATILSYGDNRTWGHFMVNGNILAKIYVHNTDHTQSTQSIVVNLNVGDDVSIQNTRLGGGLMGDSYSTFMGVLLFPTTEDINILG